MKSRLAPLLCFAVCCLGLLGLIVFCSSCATPGLLDPSSGGSPALVPVKTQGAYMLSGQQGQVGEEQQATVYANPTVYAFYLVGKSLLIMKSDKDGTTIRAESDGAGDVAGVKPAPIEITYGTECIAIDQDSGGAGTAGVEGGSTTTGRHTGDVPPAPLPPPSRP